MLLLLLLFPPPGPPVGVEFVSITDLTSCEEEVDGEVEEYPDACVGSLINLSDLPSDSIVFVSLS